MNIVDHQQIEIAHFPAEIIEFVGSQSGEKLIGEFLAREIRPSLGRMMRNELPAKALQQMCFAESASAMDEQRVVLSAGKFRDVNRAGERQPIALTHDERVDVMPQARLARLRSL
jgi:hypothetical protein